MPKISTNGVNIYYEAYGDGTPLLYLQSPLGGINPGAYYFAGRMSAYSQTIIWDSPNTGQSDMLLKKAPSEWHLLCESLNDLIVSMDIDKVNLAGCSGGGELGLLFCSLFSHKVRSLAMYRLTDTTSNMEREIIKARYLDVAQVAKQGTMNDVIEFCKNPSSSRFGHLSSWITQLYYKNMDKILGFDSAAFDEILENWGNWMAKPTFYRANLSDDELERINIPVLIVSAADKFHPEEIALELHSHLKNSTFIPTQKYRNDDEIYNGKNDKNPFGGFTDFVNEYQQFFLLL